MSRWHEKQLARLSSSVSSGTPAATVARSSMTAFAIFFVGSGLTYISQIVIARIVGATSYGYYTYVLAWMTLLAYVSAFGFDVALLRFVSVYRAQNNTGLLLGIVRYAERWVVLAGGLLVAGGIAIVLAWRQQIEPELELTFLVGLPLIPILALAWIRCAILRAHGRVILPLVASLIVRDGILIGLAIFVGVGLGRRLDAPLVMLALLIGASAGLWLASLSKRRLGLRHTVDSAPTYDAATWRRAALPLLVIGAVEVLMNRAGVLCLGWMGETKNAGIFSLMFNVAFLVAIPRTALNTLFAPTVSSLFASQDHKHLQELIGKTTVWSLGAATLIGIGLLVVANFLVAGFGSDFTAGLPALQILLVGQVVVAGAGSQLTIMTMTGHERGAAWLIVASATFNVVAMFVLARWFGMYGAALAAIFSMLVWNGLMALFIWRRLRLLPGLISIFARSDQPGVWWRRYAP